MVERFDVFLVDIDTAVNENRGGEAKNTRPAVVVSPNEMNRHLATVIVAPLSAAGVKVPTRIDVEFLNADRHIVLDQLITVEKSRLVKKIGRIDAAAKRRTLDTLAELFAE